MIWADFVWGMGLAVLGLVLGQSARRFKVDRRGAGRPLPPRGDGVPVIPPAPPPVVDVAAGCRPVTPSSAPVSPAAALERCECGHRHEHHRHRDPVKCHRCDRCAGFVLDTSPFPEATPSPSDTAEAFARLMSGHFG